MELEEDPLPYTGAMLFFFFFSLLPIPGEISSSPKLIPPARALIQAEAQGCQQGVRSS